ncbi:MAG: hypothetical protein JEZ07_05065 [Phycisphaerae bacterium]|nr:hypothetical protein [Phycisphaerae bacterium]
MISNNAQLETDDRSGVDQILAKLGSGELADRIANAARMAVANHMVMINQQMQFDVEAESPTI